MKQREPKSMKKNIKVLEKELGGTSVRYIKDKTGAQKLFVSDLIEAYGRGFLNRPGVKVTKSKIEGQTRRLISAGTFTKLKAKPKYSMIGFN